VSLSVCPLASKTYAFRAFAWINNTCDLAKNKETIKPSPAVLPKNKSYTKVWFGRWISSKAASSLLESGSVCGLFAGWKRALQFVWDQNFNRQMTRKLGIWQTCKAPANGFEGRPTVWEGTIFSSPQRVDLQRDGTLARFISRKDKKFRFRDLEIRPCVRRINHNSYSKEAARKRGGSTMYQAPLRQHSLGLPWGAVGHTLLCIVDWSEAKSQNMHMITCMIDFWLE
jgi:hypothetical protein